MLSDKKLMISLYRIIYRNNKQMAIDIKPIIINQSKNYSDIQPLLDLCKYMHYKDIDLAKLMVYKSLYQNII